MNTHLVEAERGRGTAGTTATSTMGLQDEATSVFIRAEPGLLKIAYQILGNASDAEDVIQETWLRWQGTDRTVVLRPLALLRNT
ncbi:sigma factor [Streptomyces sp. NPDC058086]|uniref:sigma factor n=1 Tax=Streptomyces sp. NPDC058086 TaxID=3346334 RepID=UPI0036E26E0D